MEEEKTLEELRKELDNLNAQKKKINRKETAITICLIAGFFVLVSIMGLIIEVLKEEHLALAIIFGIIAGIGILCYVGFFIKIDDIRETEYREKIKEVDEKISVTFQEYQDMRFAKDKKKDE